MPTTMMSTPISLRVVAIVSFSSGEKYTRGVCSPSRIVSSQNRIFFGRAFPRPDSML